MAWKHIQTHKQACLSANTLALLKISISKFKQRLIQFKYVFHKLTSKLYCDRLVGDFLNFGKLSTLCLLAMRTLGLTFSMIDAELLV